MEHALGKLGRAERKGVMANKYRAMLMDEAWRKLKGLLHFMQPKVLVAHGSGTHAVPLANSLESLFQHLRLSRLIRRQWRSQE